jgi:hypothetical protein
MYKASADIRVSRFVKASGTNTVAECDAGERPIGISSEYSEAAPLPGYAELSATSGNPASFIMVGDGQQEDRPVLLILGSGGATFGALLKSDADGAGVVASADKDCYGALALAAGSAGEAIPVRIMVGYLGA